MRIITISREFGSGGRELGKRLADFLAFDYYDREIIEAVAAGNGVEGDYAERLMESSLRKNIPLHFGRSFAAQASLQMTGIQTRFLLEQKQVIQAIGDAGKDCVVVGRDGDVLLKEYQPFKLFVCADISARLRRCQERAVGEEPLSRRRLEQEIRAVDKNRRQTREIITGSPWGERTAYHLILNTTGWDIKEMVPAVAKFAELWFAGTEDGNDKSVKG